MNEDQIASKNRLKHFLNLYNIDRKDFAEKLGYKKEYIDLILSPSSNRYPNDKFVSRFLKNYKQVNQDWLLYDKGEMLLDPNALVVSENKAEYNSTYKAILDQILQRIIAIELRIDSLEKRMSQAEQFKKISY